MQGGATYTETSCHWIVPYIKLVIVLLNFKHSHWSFTCEPLILYLSFLEIFIQDYEKPIGLPTLEHEKTCIHTVLFRSSGLPLHSRNLKSPGVGTRGHVSYSVSAKLYAVVFVNVASLQSWTSIPGCLLWAVLEGHGLPWPEEEAHSNFPLSMPLR